MTKIFQLQCEGGWVSTPVDLGKPMLHGLALVLSQGQKGVTLIDFQGTSRPIFSRSIVQHECSVQIVPIHPNLFILGMNL